MSLDTDFHSWLVSLSGGAPVQQNYESEDKTQPRVYWQRREANTDLFNNGASAISTTDYVVEVAGLDPDATATIADNIKTTSNGVLGVIGGTRVLMMAVHDATDDYIPKSMDADEGFHVYSFTVELLT
jgi:hypothetical protein